MALFRGAGPTQNPMAYTLAGMGGLAGLGGMAQGGMFGKQLGGFLGGAPGRIQQTPTMTQGQMGAQNQALQMALQGLQNPYSGFDPIERRELQRYQQETVPGLAERFTAMGGGQHSSAFEQAMRGGGIDLGNQLAALRSQYGLQQQGQMQNLLGMGLQPQFENTYMGGQPGLIEQLFPLLAKLGGAYATGGASMAF